MCSRNCIIEIIDKHDYNHYSLVAVLVTLQNCQVMVTSFGWCRCNGETHQSPDCSSSCNVWGNIGAGGWRVIVILLWRSMWG